MSVLIVWLVSAPSVRAVDIAPLLPTPDTVPAPSPFPDLTEAKPAEEAPVAPSEVLVDNLREIVFECFKPLPPCSPEVATVSATPCAAGVENRVRALGPELAAPGSELDRAVREALAGAFTWGELDALLTAATNASRAYGWSLARAFAPEQELTEGVLRVEIVPVWMENVAVKGAKWSNPERLRRAYRPFAGSVMRLSDMSGIHAFQNMHPFRRISLSLAPGAADVYPERPGEKALARLFRL